MQQLPGLGRRAVQRQAALQLSPPPSRWGGGARALKCGCWRLTRRQADCGPCKAGMRALRCGGGGAASSALRRLGCLPCLGCEPGLRSLGSSCNFCSSDPIVSYRARPAGGGGEDEQQQSRRPQATVGLDCRGLVELTKMQLRENPRGWPGAGVASVTAAERQPRLTVFDLLSGRDTWGPQAPPTSATTGSKMPQDPRPLRPTGRPAASQSLHLVLNPLGLHKVAAQGEPREGTKLPGGALPVRDGSPDVESAALSPILPFLYLGGEWDAQDLGLLRQLKVGYVINATTHLPLYHSANLRYKRLPATDSGRQNLRQYFEEAFEFIEEAQQSGKGVLVHCQAGVSRSATLVIAYLMKHTLMTMTDAYKYVKGKRPVISPNLNFMGQLLEFEMDLNEGLSPRILTPRLSGLETQV